MTGRGVELAKSYDAGTWAPKRARGFPAGRASSMASRRVAVFRSAVPRTLGTTFTVGRSIYLSAVTMAFASQKTSGIGPIAAQRRIAVRSDGPDSGVVMRSARGLLHLKSRPLRAPQPLEIRVASAGRVAASPLKIARPALRPAPAGDNEARRARLRPGFVAPSVGGETS